MLQRTFIHLPGVGLRTEARFWRQGLATWDDFLGAGQVAGLGPDRLEQCKSLIKESQRHLHRVEYFAARLSAGEHWRLFSHFRARTAYLDIETTGSSWPGLTVTVVGLYNGRCLRQFVLGQNLTKFPEAFAEVEVVVTFNGASFDLPVLEAAFPGLRLPPVHLDLRVLLARLGYKGGLKRLEPRFGISRPPTVAGLNGYDAVLLWRRCQRGDRTARDLLLAYNREDVVNLERLMESSFELGRRKLLG